MSLPALCAGSGSRQHARYAVDIPAELMPRAHHCQSLPNRGPAAAAEVVEGGVGNVSRTLDYNA